MKIVRNKVFETNSSTTHSLVLFNQIKACGIEIDNSKDVVISLIPLCDSRGNEWQEKIINTLNHTSYMVDYIYTKLMCAKYWVDNQQTQQRWLTELAEKSSELVDKMQKYLVELGYTISYRQPLVLNEEIDIYDRIYIENNDGSDLENLEDFEEILESKETFKDYLENYVWVIRYCG